MTPAGALSIIRKNCGRWFSVLKKAGKIGGTNIEGEEEKMSNKRKVVIIGAGHVGTHVASALMMQDICEEIVLLDTDEKKAWAHAVDLRDMACYTGKQTKIWSGGYGELRDADICVLSYCGLIFKEDRLEELDEALSIADSVIPQIMDSGFQGVLVSITNPCDLVALYFRLRTGLPVVGTGTALDSARFRIRIADAIGVEPSSVDAFCVGEHGNSQVPVWSQVRIGGRFLSEGKREQVDAEAIETSTIDAGWAILTGKGSTEFGIGAAAAEVIRAILTDSRQVLPCSYEYRRTADSPMIYTSMPSIVGAGGVLERLEPALSEQENARFGESCRLMEQYRAKYLDVRKF